MCLNLEISPPLPPEPGTETPSTSQSASSQSVASQLTSSQTGSAQSTSSQLASSQFASHLASLQSTSSQPASPFWAYSQLLSSPSTSSQLASSQSASPLWAYSQSTTSQLASSQPASLPLAFTQSVSSQLASSQWGFPSQLLSSQSAVSTVPPPSTSSTLSTMSLAPVDLASSLPTENMSSKIKHYDPLSSPDWDAAGPPGILCSHRVKKDMKSIFSDPLPGIFIVPEEENLFKVHCLIIGPFDTPYEGGFFHFLVRFGPQYPLHPPRVRLLTTGGGTVRFNPNLYSNGKVCLSILGTWSGPAWSPASNLSSVLLSLQSLMNENPYHNEPGYEKERNPGDSAKYNTIIEHETIRVAVLQQLQGIGSAPPELLRVMRSSFMDYYDHYVEICERNLYRDGTDMEDPFRERRGKFQYGVLLKNLEKLKEEIGASYTPTIPETPELPAANETADGDGSSTSLSDLNESAILTLSDDENEEEAEAQEE